MRILEQEVAIGGKSTDNIVIFDEPTAKNIAFYLMNKDVSGSNGDAPNFNDGTLEMIARHLLEDAGTASGYSKPTKIGENTIVYSSNYDYTQDSKVSLEGKPKNVYIVIPNGAKLKGKSTKKREVVILPGMKSSDKISEPFFNLMKEYGYSPSELTRTYNHLFGTSFQEPPKEINWKKAMVYAAAVVGFLALAYATINYTHNKVSNQANSINQMPPENYIEQNTQKLRTHKI